MPCWRRRRRASRRALASRHSCSTGSNSPCAPIWASIPSRSRSSVCRWSRCRCRSSRCRSACKSSPHRGARISRCASPTRLSRWAPSPPASHRSNATSDRANKHKIHQCRRVSPFRKPCVGGIGRLAIGSDRNHITVDPLRLANEFPQRREASCDEPSQPQYERFRVERPHLLGFRKELHMTVDETRRRAETLFKKEQQARESEQAMAEYQAELRAMREKSARLRALRLARDAANQKTPRSNQKTQRPKQKGAA